jgi:hypothetical protein
VQKLRQWPISKTGTGTSGKKTGALLAGRLDPAMTATETKVQNEYFKTGALAPSILC